MSIKIIGLDKLMKKLAVMPKKVENATEKALTKVALDLQGKAQLRAPVDTGDLRGSAFTVVGNRQNIAINTESDKNPKSARENIPSAENMQAIVGFTEPYALRQHEDMDARHPLGGEAKFLENPYKENRSKYVDMIGKAIAREVKQ